ncbi:hypothetical protein GF420_11745 [candidate division GN15 bacterium]|nr:hypothetical protein [candidate division GN15 bacterium]
MVLLLSAGTGVFADEPDRFEVIKAELGQAACTEIAFLSIIESDIFDRVDTAVGSAYIAADNRYWIELGADEYLSTGEKLYSYSRRHAQVTVERLPPGYERSTEISFIINLDEFFKTVIIQPDSAYRLYRRTDDVVGLPDSLTVFLNDDGKTLDRIEYFDVNEELNRIVFERIEPQDSCTVDRFEPSFPDSVDVIEMP